MSRSLSRKFHRIKHMIFIDIISQNPKTNNMFEYFYIIFLSSKRGVEKWQKKQKN